MAAEERVLEALKSRSKTNRAVAWIFGALVILALMLFLGANEIGKLHQWNGLFPDSGSLQTLATLMFGPALVAFLWEVGVRRQFKRELVLELGLAESVLKAGIAEATTFRDVPWRELFHDATQVDVFVAWANTWRGNQRDSIRELLGRPGTQLRVFLPDPTDDDFIRALMFKFSMSEGEIRDSILAAVRDYVQLISEAKVSDDRLQVFLHTKMPVYTMYRFDDLALVCLYTVVPHKTHELPLLWFVKGDSGSGYFTWAMSELNYMVRSNRRLLLSLLGTDASLESIRQQLADSSGPELGATEKKAEDV